MARKVARKPRATRKAARTATPTPAASAAEARAAIRRLDTAFMQAAAAGDAGALVRAFYAADAVLMPPNHPAVSGRRDIQSFLQGLIDSGLNSIKLETTVTAAAGDLAYGRGRYTLSISPPGGAAPVEDAGKYIVVYRRRAGAWQAIADIFNSDRPAA